MPVLGARLSLRINDQQDQTGQTWAPAGTLNYTQPARRWISIAKQTISPTVLKTHWTPVTGVRLILMALTMADPCVKRIQYINIQDKEVGNGWPISDTGPNIYDGLDYLM